MLLFSDSLQPSLRGGDTVCAWPAPRPDGIVDSASRGSQGGAGHSCGICRLMEVSKIYACRAAVTQGAPAKRVNADNPHPGTSQCLLVGTIWGIISRATSARVEASLDKFSASEMAQIS